MDLAKLFVSIFIGVFLLVFIGQTVSLIYPAPKSSSSYISENLCTKMVTNQCGDYSSGDYATYSNCTKQVYNSQTYKNCLTDRTKQSQEMQTSYTSRIKTYQIANLILYGLLGIVFVIVGFLCIHLRSIGTGLIIGGGYLALFGSTMSVIFGLGGSIISSLGGSSASTGFQTILTLIQIFGSLSLLVIFILFSYFKLEKEETSRNSSNL